jgi:NarL family two-component system response regulator LiaR
VAEPITIIIVDDHAVVRSGLQAYLSASADFEVVGEAATGEEAVDLIRSNIPDVVLMDLILPGMNGSMATAIIKRINPQTKIVILTSTHDDELIFSAFKSGADACVLKDMKMDNLTGAIQRAVSGEVSIHPRIAVQMLRNLVMTSDYESNSPGTLSQEEGAVLELKSKGFSNRKISIELHISEDKVNNILRSILNKLHRINQPHTLESDSVQ